MVFSAAICCRPKHQDSLKKSIKEATRHAKERGKITNKNQIVVFDTTKQAWRISTKR
jgi:5-deoxy-D-glucuronate isomerase